MKKLTWTPHVLIAATLFAISTSAHADQRSDEVDKLFARWNTSTAPGMNIAILRDGKQLYAHSYGMANLELSRPNDMGLVYPIGSISKQFAGYLHPTARQRRQAGPYGRCAALSAGDA